MILTDKSLEELGFQNNHPEYVLPKFYLSGKDFHVTVEKTYLPQSNKLGYSLSAWHSDSKGVIYKRIQYSIFTEIEDLKFALSLCDINI